MYRRGQSRRRVCAGDQLHATGFKPQPGSHMYTVMDLGTTEAAKEWIDKGTSSDHGAVRRLAHAGCVADPLVFRPQLGGGAEIAFPDAPGCTRSAIANAGCGGTPSDSMTRCQSILVGHPCRCDAAYAGART